MGSLTIPASGIVYLDTAPIIYTIERHTDYEALLLPLWAALDNKSIEVVTSELTLLETLVKPLRDGDQSLAADYEKLLTAPRVKTQPITANILRAAAGLKTPDAIHAATALAAGCVQFITNDADYRKLASLPVVVLAEII